MAGRVVWNAAALGFIERGAPQQAHRYAVQAAANKGADMIQSKYSGNLARDLSRPKHQGLYRSQVGSNLPYTTMEDRGGTIHGKPLLYIRGNRVGSSGKATRSKTGGKITAVKRSVPHTGKGFFDVMVQTYVDDCLARLRMLL